MVLQEVAQQLGLPLWALALILVWVLSWKALAMWRAARLNQPIWFIALFVINTLGLFEILYLFLFSKIKLGQSQRTRKKKKGR